MVEFEKEVVTYLNIPSIPKKEWNQTDSFQCGVAVINLSLGRQAYAVCSFDKETDKEPRITKVFGIEPFIGIKNVFVVPSYMSTSDEIKDMDLDEQSKKKVKQVLSEANELENENVSDNDELTKPKNEYYFENITNDEEARAFIQAHNSRNRIKGRIPSTHDGLVMRLAVIYSENLKKQK